MSLLTSDVIAFVLASLWFGAWGYFRHRAPRFGGLRSFRRISTR